MIEKMFEEFKPFYEKYKGQVASIAFVTDRGLIMSDNHACHAGLNCQRITGSAKISSVISGFQQCGATEAEKRIFIDYMLNHSPWKGVFLNPDVQHVIDNHWWADASVPSNFLANALVATRLPTEFPSRFNTFLAVLKAGATGDEAYIMSLLLNKNDNTFNWSMASGHICFNLRPTDEVYKRFIAHNPKDMGRPFSEAKGYTSNNGVWCNDGYGYESKKYDKLTTIIPASMTVAKNLNIFYKPPRGHVGYSFRDTDLKALSTSIKEILIA